MHIFAFGSEPRASPFSPQLESPNPIDKGRKEDEVAVNANELNIYFPK